MTLAEMVIGQRCGHLKWQISILIKAQPQEQKAQRSAAKHEITKKHTDSEDKYQ